MTPPPCDRHKNLEMVPFGQTLIDVCPVPSCGRCHDDQGYFEVVDGKLVRGQISATKKLVVAAERMVNAFRARAGP
jgi:hypothetical protein